MPGRPGYYQPAQTKPNKERKEYCGHPDQSLLEAHPG
jgi:hypothetical protein